MFYYDVVRSTTSGTAGTDTAALRALTVTNQRTAAIMGMSLACRSATAGGAILRLTTAATAGTGGTAQTPAKRDPDGPVAGTTWLNDATAITPGGTQVLRAIAGASAQGGYGGWFPATLEQAVILKPNAGANGNAEVHTISGFGSTLMDAAVEFAEL